MLIIIPIYIIYTKLGGIISKKHPKQRGFFHRSLSGSFQKENWSSRLLMNAARSTPQVFSIDAVLHPWNLTWNLKRSPWKRWFLLETIIFRFHVKFRRSIFWSPLDSLKLTVRPSKMLLWKRLSFWDFLFSSCYVSFREGIYHQIIQCITKVRLQGSRN